jgi:hypothetical protein
MDVRLPDGTIIKNVPDGISKADLTAKLQANGYDISKLNTQKFTSTTAPIEQGIPEWARKFPAAYGVAGALRETVGPLLEGGGMIGGAMAGAAGGPVGSVAGAGLGYGLGKQASRMADVALGNVQPGTLGQEAVQSAQNVAEGGMMEMGGQMLVPALGAAVKGVAKAGGAVADFATQKAKLKAADIAKKALGKELQAAQAAMRAAPADVTAGQAIADINAPTAQALLAGALQRNPEAKLAIENAQEAARMAGLQQVTPNLAAAQATRSAVAGPMYEAARNAQGVNASQALAFIDDVLAKNPGNRELVTEFNQLRAGLIDPVSGQLRTNAQQVSSVLDGIKASLGRKENKFIVDQLIKAKALISDAIPGYSGAQQQFAALSQPVNQSQILGRMQEVLASPAGGERVTPFLNALGMGENALIKTATGAPRYQVGDLNKVLAPNQMQQVTKVASELKRDASVAKQASEGREALKELLDDNISRFRLPQWISAPVALANRSLEELEKKLGKDIMRELTKASQSGKSMDELLSTLPVAQRNKFLRTMQDTASWLPRQSGPEMSFQGLQIPSTINMLAGPQENQNELAR